MSVRPLPTDPDVVVVGAGTAGLAAATALQDLGLEVLALEAADHVGGRCITDTTSLSMPFDRGGSWLHSAAINPLARIAEAKGEDLHKADWDWNWVRTPERSLAGPELAGYRDYHDRMWQAIKDAGAAGEDVSAAAALPPSPWRETARHWVAQMQGGDADAVSAADVQRYAEADGDWLVAGGLGAFVRRLHADAPVRLNCPVTKIDALGRDVRVTTPDGTVQAKAVVVTVSTGVLASNKIEFSPPLPDAKKAAVADLPMGLLNKVGFEFDPHWAGAHQGEMADYASCGDAFCTLLFGFYDSPLAVGFLAGRFASETEAEGPGAATAYCLQALRDIFGSDVDKSIRTSCETAWRGDPHTLGSYSYATPSCADARAVLAAPVDGKIYFAGEATMKDAYATVHGAYQSGLNAAALLAKRLGRGQFTTTT